MTDYAPGARAPEVPIEDVVWRIDGNPSNGRARFVPFIDSRVCASLLDQWVGPWNWRDEYEPATIDGKNAMYCHLEIRDPETGEWVRKTDVGSPTGFEAQKGIMSDSFKRAACLKWGVGRNVYDLPGDVWAPCDVYQKNGKDQGRANSQSVPAILAELKKRGFDTASTRAETEGTVRSDTDATPNDVVPIDEEQLLSLKGMFDDFIDDPAVRLAAKKEFAKTWGDPALLPATKLDEAVKAATKIIVAHTPDPVEPVAAAESATDVPGPAPSPTAAPQPTPAATGEGEGLTAEQVLSMDARTITPLLTEYGLPTTGRLDAKRQALLNHLFGGGADETPVEQYLEGILKYEEQLDDLTDWLAWWYEMFENQAAEELSPENAKTAYEYIRKLVEGDVA